MTEQLKIPKICPECGGEMSKVKTLGYPMVYTCWCGYEELFHKVREDND